MFNKICIATIILIQFTIFAQDKDKDKDSRTMEHGTNAIEWKIYATEGPALTFSMTSSHLWFSNGSSVGTYNLRTNIKKMIPKLGDIPSTGITTISSDSKGNIWFGGSNGIILKEKNKFKIFNKENGLVENAVTKILCHSGSVWVGTNNGISCYKNGSWKSFTTAQGVCGDNIRGITNDDKGTVYFATNNGIAIFKGNKWSKFDMSTGLSSNNINAVGYDSRKGTLWAAVGQLDVDSYDGKKWNTYMDIQTDITTILADTQSRIWFGSLNGILKYNGFEWVTDPKKVGFPAAQVTDSYKDKKGDLYFAMESGVLHMTNPYPY